MEEPLDALDEVLQEGYGEKAIRVRSRDSRAPKGVVVKEVNLRISR